MATFSSAATILSHASVCKYAQRKVGRQNDGYRMMHAAGGIMGSDPSGTLSAAFVRLHVGGIAMKKAADTNRPKVYALSGGTGRTAQQVIQAALAQFPENAAEVVLESNIRTVARAIAVVEQACKENAILCHTLVSPTVRAAVEDRVRKRNVPCIDVLGPALAMLGNHLQVTPRGRAGLLHELHREQFDRMDAVDFAMAHDDGRRAGELKVADVVLVGASRVSKSVTCFYLASRGVRAANVPLIPDHPPPVELTKLPSKRVIALTMNASHLASIRQARAERISTRTVPKYAELQDVIAELRWVSDLISRHKWRTIDVSYRATEEVTSQIIEMIAPTERRSGSSRRKMRSTSRAANSS